MLGYFGLFIVIIKTLETTTKKIFKKIKVLLLIFFVELNKSYINSFHINNIFINSFKNSYINIK